MRTAFLLCGLILGGVWAELCRFTFEHPDSDIVGCFVAVVPITILVLIGSIVLDMEDR